MGIIELVEKREYDSLLSQLDSVKDYNVKLLKAFNHLSTRLATIAFDPVQPMHFAENVANHVDDLRDEINHGEKARLADVIARIVFDKIASKKKEDNNA